MTAMPWLAAAPDAPVALTPAGVRTHADLWRAVRARASELAIRPQADWSLWHDDSYEFLVGLFSLLAAGKRVLLPPNATPDTLQRLAAAGAQPYHLTFPTLPAITAEMSAAPLAPDADGALVFYTSGSTGEPKQIPRTLRQLLREVATLQEVFTPEVPGAPVLATVSHQHIYGLLFKVLWPLASGRPFHSTLLEYPEQVLTEAERHPGATLVASPALLKRWPDNLRCDALSCIVSSGGVLPAISRAAMAAVSRAPLIEVLGSSETGGIAWRLDAGSWQAFPDVEVRLRDIRVGGDDESAVDDEVLEVRSAHAFTSDWITTGDSARLDATGGRFTLGPRLNRLVKIEEKRISLDAVEMALRGHPDIADAHVLLIEGQARQALSAVVVLTPDGEAALGSVGKTAYTRQLRQALAASLEPLARPRRWRFVPQLPCNAQGKFDFTAMRDLFQPPRLPILQSLVRDGDSLRITAQLPADLFWFQGHFPQAAVLPGVAQLGWVEHFAREHFGLQGRFVRMEQLKFQEILRPLSLVDIEIDFQRERERLVFRFFRDGHNYSSGRMVYTEAS